MRSLHRHLGARWGRQVVWNETIVMTNGCSQAGQATGTGTAKSSRRRSLQWDLDARWHRKVVLGRSGRSLGPDNCLGRDRCNETWALAGTGKLSLATWKCLRNILVSKTALCLCNVILELEVSWPNRIRDSLALLSWVTTAFAGTGKSSRTRSL